MTNLKALAARCVDLSEDAREVEVLVHLALNPNCKVMTDGGDWKGTIPATYEPASVVWETFNGPAKDFADIIDALPVMRSIDAAMSLARDGREAEQALRWSLTEMAIRDIAKADFVRLLPRYICAAALTMRSE